MLRPRTGQWQKGKSQGENLNWSTGSAFKVYFVDSHEQESVWSWVIWKTVLYQNEENEEFLDARSRSWLPPLVATSESVEEWPKWCIIAVRLISILMQLDMLRLLISFLWCSWCGWPWLCFRGLSFTHPLWSYTKGSESYDFLQHLHVMCHACHVLNTKKRKKNLCTPKKLQLILTQVTGCADDSLCKSLWDLSLKVKWKWTNLLLKSSALSLWPFKGLIKLIKHRSKDKLVSQLPQYYQYVLVYNTSDDN